MKLCLVAIGLLVTACLATMPCQVHAQTTVGQMLDSTCALVGGDSIDQLAARPVTTGEVSFVAALMAARAKGDSGTPLSEAYAVEALRACVLVRLLAYKARVLGERASGSEVRELGRTVTKTLGGSAALDLLLSRFGMSKAGYLGWLQDTVLAQTQLEYVVEQSDSGIAELGPGENAIPKQRLRSLKALALFVESAVNDGTLRVLP